MDVSLLQELEATRAKFYELRSKIAADLSSETVPDLDTAKMYYMSIITDGLSMLRGESNKFRAHLSRVIGTDVNENQKAFRCMEDLVDIAIRALDEIVIQSERMKV